MRIAAYTHKNLGEVKDPAPEYGFDEVGADRHDEAGPKKVPLLAIGVRHAGDGEVLTDRRTD